MSINFEALDLRAFVAVVDLEGFHRAAEALNLSQPALSRRIQKLEAAVGAALLERTTRRVALTTVGREFLPLVRRMLDEFDSSLFAMRDVGRQRRGLISLACVPTAAFYFLPSVIARFNEQYPNIRFRILDLSANEGLESVARGEVEFGINLLGASDPELVVRAPDRGSLCPGLPTGPPAGPTGRCRVVGSRGPAACGREPDQRQPHHAGCSTRASRCKPELVL